MPTEHVIVFEVIQVTHVRTFAPINAVAMESAQTVCVSVLQVMLVMIVQMQLVAVVTVIVLRQEHVSAMQDLWAICVTLRSSVLCAARTEHAVLGFVSVCRIGMVRHAMKPPRNAESAQHMADAIAWRESACVGLCRVLLRTKTCMKVKCFHCFRSSAVAIRACGVMSWQGVFAQVYGMGIRARNYIAKIGTRMPTNPNVLAMALAYMGLVSASRDGARHQTVQRQTFARSGCARQIAWVMVCAMVVHVFVMMGGRAQHAKSQNV